MAEDTLPIKIVIIPPSSASVTRAMADIEAKVKASGRKIGRAEKASGDKRISQQKALGAHLAKLESTHMKAIIMNRARDEAIALGQKKTFDAQLLSQKKKTLKAIVAMEKRAAQQAFAASSAGIFKAAGIKGSGQRLKELKALKRAQAQLRTELKRGIITRLQYNTMLDDTRKKMNLLNRGNVRARGAIHQLIARTASLTFELTGAVFGLVTLGAALASPALLGVSFLRKMEDTKLGITGIMLAMGSADGEALNFSQGMQVAEEQVEQLAIESMRLSGTLTDFTRSFQAILAPGMAAGMTLDEIRQIAVAGTVAVKTIGLDSRQVVQEIRDLVAGGIQAASSTLATSLGLKDSDIKKAKLSSEGLFTFLIKQLEGFRTAGLEREQTLSGKLERTWEAFVISLSKVSEPAFQVIKDLLDEVFDKIATVDELTDVVTFNEDFVNGIRDYIEGLAKALEIITKILSVMWEWRKVLTIIMAIWLGNKIFAVLATAINTYRLALLGAIAAEKLHAVSMLTNSKIAKTKLAVALGGIFTAGTGKFNVLKTGLTAFFSSGLPKLFAGVAKFALAAAGPIGIIGAILWGAYSLFDAESDTEKVARRIEELGKDSREARKLLANEDLKAAKAAIAAKEEFISLQETRLGDVLDDPDIAGDDPVVERLEKSIAAAEGDLGILEDKLKSLGNTFTEVEEAPEKFSDSVKRMNGSLINAKKALEGTGSAFLKGITEAEGSTQLSSTLVALERDYQNLIEKQKNLTEDEKGNKVLEARKAAMDELLLMIQKSTVQEEKLADLRSKVKAGGITTKERDILKDQLSIQEKIAQKEGFLFQNAKDILDTEKAIADFKKEGEKGRAGVEAGEAHLANLKVQKERVESNVRLEKSIDNVTGKQVKADEKLKELTKTTRDYGVSLQETLDQKRAELEFAGTDGRGVEKLREELDLKKKITEIEDKHQKIIAEITAGKTIDGYINIADAQAQQNEEVRKAIELLRQFQAEQDKIHEKSRTWAQGQKTVLKQYIADAQNDAALATEFYGGIFGVLEDDMTRFFKEGIANFDNFVKAILDGLLKIMIQKMLAGIIGGIGTGGAGADPTGAGASGFTSGGAEGLGFAKGGVFDPTGIKAFSEGGVFGKSGGIVSEPTLFKFAQGTGLMGEAGAEAIMPLSRTTSGDLGVKVDGGAGGVGMVNNISIEVNVAQDGTATTEVNSAQGSEDAKALGNIIGVRVREEIIQQKRPGGLLSR